MSNSICQSIFLFNFIYFLEFVNPSNLHLCGKQQRQHCAYRLILCSTEEEKSHTGFEGHEVK